MSEKFRSAPVVLRGSVDVKPRTFGKHSVAVCRGNHNEECATIADSLSLISLDDSTGERDRGVQSQNQKRVSFVSDERLVRVRHISPRSVSPMGDQSSYFYADGDAFSDLSVHTVTFERRKTFARLVSRNLLGLLRANNRTLPSPPVKVRGNQFPRRPIRHVHRQPRTATSVGGDQTDTFTTTSKPIQKANGMRPHSTGSARTNSATSSDGVRASGRRRLIEFTTNGLNSGDLLDMPFGVQRYFSSTKCDGIGLNRPVTSAQLTELAPNGGGLSRLSDYRMKLLAWQAANTSHGPQTSARLPEM